MKSTKAQSLDAKNPSPPAVPPPYLHRCRTLSHPAPAFDDALTDATVLALGEALTGSLLERHGDAIAARSEGLVEALTPPWGLALPMRTLWDPSVGAVEQFLHFGSGRAVDVAVSLALRLAQAGRAANWSAVLEEECRPRWDGWWLPPTVRIGVASDGLRARVETGPGSGAPARTADFRAEDGGWQAADVRPGPGGGTGSRRVAAVPGTGRPLQLLPAPLVARQVPLDDGDGTVTFPEKTGPALVRSFQDAMALLRRAAPPFSAWVERVVGAIVPCRCADGRMRSGSWGELPGVVLVSATGSAAGIAEMLVHEASHHYYYLAKRLGDVADPAHDRLYYSPAVGRERSLERVLLAYHAFANVLLMYEALGRTEPGAASDLAGRIDRTRRDVDTLARPLRENDDALTDLGRALVMPLLERLGQR